jgi:hypothetical protein
MPVLARKGVPRVADWACERCTRSITAAPSLLDPTQANVRRVAAAIRAQAPLPLSIGAHSPRDFAPVSIDTSGLSQSR